MSRFYYKIFFYKITNMPFCNIAISHSSTPYDTVGKMFKLKLWVTTSILLPYQPHSSVTSARHCIKLIPPILMLNSEASFFFNLPMLSNIKNIYLRYFIDTKITYILQILIWAIFVQGEVNQVLMSYFLFYFLKSVMSTINSEKDYTLFKRKHQKIFH